MSLRRSLFVVVLAAALVAACDDTPGTTPLDRQPPTVTEFDYVPQTVRVADLPPDRVNEDDSTAQVDLRLVARAVDPDGALDRVTFSIEPSRTPSAALRGRLDSIAPDVYGVAIDLGVPAFVDESYTLRVFAVDADSLISNQALGQFRVVPDTTQ